MAYTQKNRLLSLSTPLGEDILLLTSFSGSEGITQPSRFTLDTISEYDIDSESLIGQSVNFDVELDDGSFRIFNGVVNEVTPKGLVNQTFRRYQLKVITQLDMLKMKEDNRHFRDQSHLDTILYVLRDEHKLNVEDLTTKTYVKREYSAQYKESDYTFVHRLLKEEGINYFITHEKGKHTVVLFDGVASYRGHNESLIEYVDGDSANRRFYNWHKEITFPTGQVSQRSFNFKRPLEPVKSTTTTILPVEKAKQYEHYHYPALNNELKDSRDESRRLMESHENLHTLVKVNTNCRSLQTGQKFSFSRHIDDAECGEEYVITGINYSASDDTYLNQSDEAQKFECKLDCMPSDILYRTTKQYPRPTAEGVQTAIVCGPEGQEVHTDDLGRVKVQFHWDRLSERNDESSCWIRVAQPWAGNGYGTLFIPRIGQEVMVYFEDGDINKPLIFGGLYNGKNSSPQNLPANKTQTSIKSRSSTGADPAMFNEVRFEDKKGEEELYLQAQKDRTTIVKDSHVRVVGGDQNVSVGNDRFEAIKKDRVTYIAEGSESLQAEKDISFQSVDGSIYLHAAEFIEFVVGSASLTLSSDGKINVNGKIVHIDGKDGVVVNGGAALSLTTPTPMGLDGIYTTPSSPGAPVPQFSAVPLVQKISEGAANHLSRAAAAGNAFSSVVSQSTQLNPNTELHEVHLEYKMENGEPMKGAPYTLTESTGAVRSGFLDGNGQAHITGLQPGSVEIEYFPSESDAEVKQLRNQIKATLGAIIEDEKKEAAALQAEQDAMNPIMNALSHTWAGAKGVGNAAWDGVKFVKEVSDIANPIVTLSNASKAAWQAYKGDHTKPFLQEFLTNFSEEQKNEVVDILGFDPSAVTKEQIAEAYEITTSIMDDPESRQLLADFAVDYAKAQDSIELANFGGGVVFEIILAAIIAALTGGVGLAVVAGKSVKNVKYLAKLGDLFVSLSKRLKKLKFKKKGAGSSNSVIDTKVKVADEVDINKKGVKSKLLLNRQGIPVEYLDEVAEATGRSRADIEKLYDSMENEYGIDYKSFISNYVENNPYGLDLKDAHLVMGYTTNFFMKGRLAPRMITGADLTGAEKKLIASLNTALDKLPSQQGTFYRGLDISPDGLDGFNAKYSESAIISDNIFSSVSEVLSGNYKGNVMMEFDAKNVKDISDLAMDVNFADKIEQIPAKTEHLIQTGRTFKVLSNESGNILLKEVVE